MPFYRGTIYSSLEITKKLYKFVEFISNLSWNYFFLNTNISWFQKKSSEKLIQISILKVNIDTELRNMKFYYYFQCIKLEKKKNIIQ